MDENPQGHLLTLFQFFFKDLKDYTSGYPIYPAGKRTFSKDAKVLYHGFKADILQSEPTFAAEADPTSPLNGDASKEPSAKPLEQSKRTSSSKRL